MKTANAIIALVVIVVILAGGYYVLYPPATTPPSGGTGGSGSTGGSSGNSGGSGSGGGTTVQFSNPVTAPAVQLEPAYDCDANVVDQQLAAELGSAFSSHKEAKSFVPYPLTDCYVWDNGVPVVKLQVINTIDPTDAAQVVQDKVDAWSAELPNPTVTMIPGQGNAYHVSDRINGQFIDHYVFQDRSDPAAVVVVEEDSPGAIPPDTVVGIANIMAKVI